MSRSLSPKHPLPLSFYKVLMYACAFLLFGRAWQHFLLAPNWTGFFPPASVFYESFTLVVGIIFLLGMAASFYARSTRLAFAITLYISGLLLFFLEVSSTIAKGFNPIQFFEHIGQISTPFLLMGFLYYPKSSKKLLQLLRLATAITFTCHGLFALGVWYPVPPHFVAMVKGILGLSPDGAIWFLRIAGILDLVVSVLIFLPKYARLPLAYAVVWGLLTSLARTVAYFDASQMADSLIQWLPQTLWRLPHAGLPLSLLILYRFHKREEIGELVNS